jgi:hypothetical protein
MVSRYFRCGLMCLEIDQEPAQDTEPLDRGCPLPTTAGCTRPFHGQLRTDWRSRIALCHILNKRVQGLPIIAEVKTEGSAEGEVPLDMRF